MEGNGTKTNEAIEASAFAGKILEWQDNAEKRLDNMDRKLDRVLAFQNKQLGFVAAISALISLIAAFLK